MQSTPWVRPIKGVGPTGIDNLYDETHVARYMEHIAAMLTPEDVTAITIHREGGDYRYEWADGRAERT